MSPKHAKYHTMPCIALWCLMCKRHKESPPNNHQSRAISFGKLLLRGWTSSVHHRTDHRMLSSGRPAFESRPGPPVSRPKSQPGKVSACFPNQDQYYWCYVSGCWDGSSYSLPRAHGDTYLLLDWGGLRRDATFAANQPPFNDQN